MEDLDILLQGAIDLHTHSAPSIYSRGLDDFQLAEQGLAAKLRAVVIKAHEGTSVFRAQLVQKAIPGIEVFGGIVLNHFVGGLNKFALECSLEAGARIVWFPTVSAENHLRFYSRNSLPAINQFSLFRPERGINILTNDGQIRPEVRDILDILARRSVVVATGHLSVEEIKALAGEAQRRGIQRILVNHADVQIIGMSIEEQVNLAKSGAFIEKCAIALTEEVSSISSGEMAESIRAIGAEHCVLATDFGQPGNPFPVQGLKNVVSSLLRFGISDEEIVTMIRDNPAYLLGID